ncbi:MAG: hypothetical protein KatS3mg095_0398 [Candidatus Parcubacteria bacterium]|nr:MAG: hypothetical protein KatS3mg095_0398 [Candidatus Parcubacteria bacterium]
MKNNFRRLLTDMRTPLIILSVVVLIVVGWLLISKTGQHQNMNQKIITTQTQPSLKLNKAPDFQLEDYDGKVVKLSDFKNMPVVVNFWAGWCPFCQKELKDFALAQKEFKDKVVIIAINRGESREKAKKFTDELGITNDLIFLLDPNDSYYKTAGGFAMPETIFIDKDNNIIEHKRGPIELDELKLKLNNLISS